MEKASKYTYRIMPDWLPVLLLFLLPASLNGQRPVSPDEAVEMALESNAGVQASQLRASSASARKGTAWDIEKTGVYVNYDENNIAHNGEPITVWGVQQDFRFPLVYAAGKKVLAQEEKMQEHLHLDTRRQLRRDVLKAYYDVVCYRCMEQHYQVLDTLFARYAEAAVRRQETGETNSLDVLMARSKKDEISVRLQQVREDRLAAQNRLMRFVQSEEEITAALDTAPRLKVRGGEIQDNPLLAYQEASMMKARQQLRTARLNWLPDISLGYFQGTNDYPEARVYKGFEVGLSFPLFFGSQNSETKARRLNWEAARQEVQETEQQLSGKIESLQAQLNKLARPLDVFEERGRELAEEMTRTARRSYEEGEIGMSEYVAAVEQARRTMVDYFKNLRQYNHTVLEINYLIR